MDSLPRATTGRIPSQQPMQNPIRPFKIQLPVSGKVISIFIKSLQAVAPMCARVSVKVALLSALLAVIVIPVPESLAQGPQTPSCGTFIVEKDIKIQGHVFKRGKYQINTFGISCEKVMGKYGLFDQFLSQDENTPLPKPWKYLSKAVGAPKFVAAPGVGFRAQRLSD
ncbi:MAG: hypothetical protein EXS42_05280 [Lacunisphaera sp.]|nr:hypothetical protein [Lacunisphaera sp.]